MNGALARFNLNADKLNPKAKKVAEALGMKPPITMPYFNTAAQLVECMHYMEESIAILEELKENGTDKSEAITVGLNERNDIPVKAGIGVGAVEVPRGLLFHEYEVDEKGKIINANCIIPTSQNVNNIEHDMKKLIVEIMDKPDEEIIEEPEKPDKAPVEESYKEPQDVPEKGGDE